MTTTYHGLIGAFFIEAVEGGSWYMGNGYWTDNVCNALYRGCREAIERDAAGLPARSYLIVKMGVDGWTRPARD